MRLLLAAMAVLPLLLMGCPEKAQDPSDLEAKANDMKSDTPSAEGDHQAGNSGGGEAGGAGGEAGDGAAAAPADGGEAGAGGEGGEAPPDPAAAGGGAAAGAPPGHQTPFESGYGDGAMITVSGTLVVDEGVTGVVDIDCFSPSAEDPNKKDLVNKVKVHQPGAYSMKVPKDFGKLVLEAFIDSDGDGPDDSDARGEYAGNPLVIGAEDISGVDIELIEPPKSAGGGAWRGGGRKEIETDKEDR